MSAASPLARHAAGEGPPVVLLNGGFMSFGAWEPVTTRLCARYRVLGFDFRGQLLSPGAGPADLAGHAADVAALLDDVGWESAHLVGTSFGAEVALELATAAPRRARSLTLVTAMDRATDEFDRESRRMRALAARADEPGAREEFWDVMVERVYSAGYRESQAAALAARRARLSELPEFWFAGVDRLIDAIEGFDLAAKLDAVRAPALVVMAADDRVMSAVRSHALADALGAELAVHPSSGHALVAEDPEWLAATTLDFLDRCCHADR